MMFRKLMMICAAVLGLSVAAMAMTPATMKTHGHDSGTQDPTMGYGRCRWCYCPGYVYRGNGRCGRCGHWYLDHGGIPG
jgi:hypothetical protein